MYVTGTLPSDKLPIFFLKPNLIKTRVFMLSRFSHSWLLFEREVFLLLVFLMQSLGMKVGINMQHVTGALFN
jgi:hypothetical protein